MNPLCTLRYSATHVDKHHMVYRLDAVDAYERKLVKQIEVAAAEVEGAHNKPYRAARVGRATKRGSITAKVELDVQTASGVSRQEVHRTGRRQPRADHQARDLADCRIGEIRVGKGQGVLELRVPGRRAFLKLGQAFGDVDALAVQREMIRRTIKEHLDKENATAPAGHQGAVSLFFIDAVEQYRKYDADGNASEGRVRPSSSRRSTAGWLGSPTTRACSRRWTSTTRRRGGARWLFLDRQEEGGWTDTAENNQDNRDNAETRLQPDHEGQGKAAELRDAAQVHLLPFGPAEGWDNPNVFQICALREMRHRARAPADHRARPAPVREPARRAAARLRGEHADGRRHRELRAVRREPAEGDRERHRHPFRHRGEAPVCRRSR